MSKRDSVSPTGPSQRQLRVGELIRHALSEALARGDIHDDIIAGHIITVSEVRMSPDLKAATVFVMPLGGGDIREVLAALERNSRYIRGLVAKAVNLRSAPNVVFREDKSFDSGHRIDRLLDSLKPSDKSDADNIEE